jgi:hypothetical protein
MDVLSLSAGVLVADIDKSESLASNYHSGASAEILRQMLLGRLSRALLG